MAAGHTRFWALLIVGVAIVTGCDAATTTTTTPHVETTTVPSTPPTDPSSTTTTTTEAEIQAADIVYTGGDVVTMDPALGTVDAIAIRGDRIAAVGSASELEGYIGPDTVVVDTSGLAVHPGFVDPHTHVLTDMGGIESGQKLALAAGITSLGDASIEPGLAETFAAASESGLLKIRTTLYLTRTDPCGEDFGDWYLEIPADSELADRVRVAGVKIFADGGVCGLIAASEPWLADIPLAPPYHDEPSSSTGSDRPMGPDTRCWSMPRVISPSSRCRMPMPRSSATAGTHSDTASTTTCS